MFYDGHLKVGEREPQPYPNEHAFVKWDKTTIKGTTYHFFQNHRKNRPIQGPTTVTSIAYIVASVFRTDGSPLLFAFIQPYFTTLTSFTNDTPLWAWSLTLKCTSGLIQEIASDLPRYSKWVLISVSPSSQLLVIR